MTVNVTIQVQGAERDRISQTAHNPGVPHTPPVMQKIGINPRPVHFFAPFLAVWGAAAHHRGLVVTRLRCIPVMGESIVEADYRFTVEEALERTVLKLRVARRARLRRHRSATNGGDADAPFSPTA